MNSRTPDATTAPHARTTVRPAGKSPSVAATLLATLVAHLTAAAFVAPVAVTVSVGAGLLLAVAVGFVVAGLRDRVDTAALRRRATARDPRHTARDGAPCHGADC